MKRAEARLRELFDSYGPRLTSDFVFMQRLERNLDAVELVKSRNEATLRRSRRAVLVALLVGFTAGCLLTLAVPCIAQFVDTLLASSTSSIVTSSSSLIATGGTFVGYSLNSLFPAPGILVGWLLAAATTMLVSVSTFLALTATPSLSDKSR